MKRPRVPPADAPAPEPAPPPPSVFEPSPPPPAARDPWVWVAVASVLVMIAHVRGAALGEPVLDDLLYLRHLTLLHRFHLLDGGGLLYYWRPLGRQVYFGLLGPLMLTQPIVVASLHVALLAATTWLLYRALRPTWPGAWAAAAASFPVLHESASMLIAWPSNFQDLGAMLFGALAVHEASRRRLWTAVAALAASLFCKEVAVVTAVLLPLVSRRGGTPWRERIRIGVAAALTVIAWGALYGSAIRWGGILMPRDAPGSEHTFNVPWLVRYLWVLRRSVADALNLSATAAWMRPGTLVFGVLLLATLAIFAISRRSRARLRVALPWIGWGAVWFLGASATLPAIFPGWAPYRSVFAAMGLGLACAGLFGAAHAALLAALVAARVALLALAPGAAPVITVMPPAADVVLDFPTLSRLQLVLQQTRVTLRRGVPTMPAQGQVCAHYLPRLSDYAMKGDASLQAWDRDTTLAWVGYSDFRADTTRPIATVVEYQPEMRPPVALVAPDAMRAFLAATRRLEASNTRGALGDLARAERLQRDTGARVFLGTVASKRAVCLLELGPPEAALREAQRALRIWPDNLDSRYVIASVLADRKQYAEAEAQLDTLLTANPGDEGAVELLERVRKGGR